MRSYFVGAMSILYCLSLLASCAPGPELEISKIEHSIYGFVGASLSEPAVSEVVVLLDGHSGTPIRSAETDWAGKYRFSDLSPGLYLIKVGRIAHRVMLNDGAKRLDIKLDNCPTCPKR
ncbi:MAG: carboxypeptidase-like regulatory domain-containing protein [Thermodesulfobacteriota bacterium]|nr:carboxypeptidase-like regulatory domain-containing protein [Thermodesulfobacteriota bacterium]